MSKHYLFGAASAMALVLGMSGTALAFDDVNWNWNSNINTWVDSHVTVNADYDLTGLVQVESLQIHIGDASAVSNVSNVYNNQPSGGGSVGPITLTFDKTGYTQSGSFSGSLSGSGATGTIAGKVDEGNWGLYDGSLKGTVTIDHIAVAPTATFDALTELPKVESIATAVMNNASIDSQQAVFLHNGQFAMGSNTSPSTADVLGLAGGALAGYGVVQGGVSNTNVVGAAGLMTAALLGGINQGSVSAASNVGNILNATVDSAATAVGNNASVTVTPNATLPPGYYSDAVVLGDNVQFAAANLSASSNVSNVTLNSYSNLGKIDRPIVSSAATAVGNNLSITVKKP